MSIIQQARSIAARLSRGQGCITSQISGLSGRPSSTYSYAYAYSCTSVTPLLRSSNQPSLFLPGLRPPRRKVLQRRHS
jgi:hypothetical protein